MFMPVFQELTGRLISRGRDLAFWVSVTICLAWDVFLTPSITSTVGIQLRMLQWGARVRSPLTVRLMHRGLPVACLLQTQELPSVPLWRPFPSRLRPSWLFRVPLNKGLFFFLHPGLLSFAFRLEVLLHSPHFSLTPWSLSLEAALRKSWRNHSGAQPTALPWAPSHQGSHWAFPLFHSFLLLGFAKRWFFQHTKSGSSYHLFIQTFLDLWGKLFSFPPPPPLQFEMELRIPNLLNYDSPPKDTRIIISMEKLASISPWGVLLKMMYTLIFKMIPVSWVVLTSQSLCWMLSLAGRVCSLESLPPQLGRNLIF